MTVDEITHHCIWHSSPATIVAKTLALALLPVFDLVRPHDLIHYHEDGFPKVVGRPCTVLYGQYRVATPPWPTSSAI